MLETVDFNVNGACQLNCGFCWGPDHDVKETITINQWKQIASDFQQAGVKHIVFTGGEPLLKKNLHDLACFVHENLGMRTTLSTNGILIEKAPDLFGYMDEIGIPIDGPTNRTNSQMRIGEPKHLDLALGALYVIQRDYSMIDLTVRTVVSNLNKDKIPKIGAILRDNFFIDISELRWKLYQYQPIGPRVSNISNKMYFINDDTFEHVVSTTREANPYMKIVSQKISDSDGRYLHIQPDGSAIAIKSLTPSTLPQEILLGNILEDFTGVFTKADRLLDKNHLHGQFT